MYNYTDRGGSKLRFHPAMFVHNFNSNLDVFFSGWVQFVTQHAASHTGKILGNDSMVLCNKPSLHCRWKVMWQGEGIWQGCFSCTFSFEDFLLSHQPFSLNVRIAYKCETYKLCKFVIITQSTYLILCHQIQKICLGSWL